MSAKSHPYNSAEAVSTAAFEIQDISLESPWRWIRLGWQSMWKSPAVSLSYGLMFALVSAGLAWGMFQIEASSILPAFAAGFMLVGPILAMGLYETSRRLEAGQRPTFGAALRALLGSSNQVRFAGVMLMFILLVWMRVATLIFALFFGMEYPPLADFITSLLFTPAGLGMLIAGTAIGAVFAFIVFAISAVSIPLLMVHDVDAVTAAATSVKAVLRNPASLILWGWIITVIMIAGILTAFVGMILAFPLVGHATWHAYKDLVKKVD